MSILDRYFLREFFKPLLACLVAFLMCMLVWDLLDNMRDFQTAHTPLSQMLRYYAILLPAWTVDIMPISLLLALLYTLATMSKYGELTAMRAGGLDFVRLMGPYFVVGVCITIQILCVNLAWAPTASLKSKLHLEASTNKNADPTSNATAVSYYSVLGNRHWYAALVNPVEQSAWGIEVTQAGENADHEGKRDIRRISAVSGVYRRGHWLLSQVKVYDYTKPDWDPASLKILDNLDVREFTESPKQFVAAAQKTKRMTTSNLLELLKWSSRLSPRQRAIYGLELHWRIAFPMFNFIVFLIGIPSGVTNQRSSNFMAIIYAFALFFGYVALEKFILAPIALTGRIPAWFAAWLPNILFTGIGVWLIRRIR